MAGKSQLTTTSYAILGHLAMRPWTMYDLAAEMRRNVHFFFPRAESQVYLEPKRLVEHGLARAEREVHGKRARTVYSITDDGRAELARWLAGPVSKGPQLEFEALLRVMLSPFGTDADLAKTIGQVREDIAGLFAVADRITQEYSTGRAPFQSHAQYRSIMHDFLYSFGKLVDEWAARSLERMRQWPEQSEDERREAGVEVFRNLSRAWERQHPRARRR